MKKTRKAEMNRRISAKISKLEREGKPHDQAVAQGINMVKEAMKNARKRKKKRE